MSTGLKEKKSVDGAALLINHKKLSGTLYLL